MGVYAIEMLGITKSFGGLVANNNINLLVPQQTIHGIIGENGAGKSTLMSILFGLYQANAGQIKINGAEVNIKSPHDASRYGIGMVHQHFKLVDIYNAIDNIILGNEMSTLGFLHRKKAHEKIATLAARYHFDVDLKSPVHRLSVGQQQKVEILKTLFLDASILIFDEPTAVLTPQEIEGFLKLLKQFKKEGKTVVLITHKLEEIRAVCDRATIIRHGRVVADVQVKDVSVREMAKLMVGNEVHDVKNKHVADLGPVVLEVREVADQKLDRVSFVVHAGEIVAIAGVEGNGQSQIVQAVTGLSRVTAGHIFLNHKLIPAKPSGRLKGHVPLLASRAIAAPANPLLDITHKSIKQRINLGIAHIPEDRHRHGLVLDFKIKYGLAIKKIREFSWLGIINDRALTQYAQRIIQKYDVRGANNGEALARQLSGGNQQKAILGRELESQHILSVIAQPTRGLDVGAIINVHEQILQEKTAGRAVLLVSYELSEVLALADRIIVVSNGKITGNVLAHETTRQELGLMMAGITSPSEVRSA